MEEITIQRRVLMLEWKKTLEMIKYTKPGTNGNLVDW